MCPPPPVHAHENANGLLLQKIWSRVSFQESGALDVVLNLKPYRPNSGHPPTTHAPGTGLLQQSVRPKRLFASSHWSIPVPRNSITISPLAAQHHMSVSCGRNVTGCDPAGAGTQTVGPGPGPGPGWILPRPP